MCWVGLMNNYDSLIEYRDELVDDIGPWAWIKNDVQAWRGLIDDWNNSHKRVYKTHITDYSVCVQAGGCMGMYPRLLSEMFGRVYTFEPDPHNFYCLTLNCQKDNIIKMQAALGNESRLVSINLPEDNNRGTRTINENYKIIPMLTIDSLQLDACGFIQLDVEYYELNVLRGALETVREYKPVITCELGTLSYFNQARQDGLHHRGRKLTNNTLNDDILDLLSPFGYQKVDQTVADAVYKVV